MMNALKRGETSINRARTCSFHRADAENAAALWPASRARGLSPGDRACLAVASADRVWRAGAAAACLAGEVRGLATDPGLFQMLIVTPVSIGAGFTSTASFVVIAAADLLTAAVGVALLRAPDTSEPLVHTQRAHPLEQGSLGAL